jgi:hypothetical protein
VHFRVVLAGSRLGIVVPILFILGLIGLNRSIVHPVLLGLGRLGLVEGNRRFLAKTGSLLTRLVLAISIG